MWELWRAWYLSLTYFSSPSLTGYVRDICVRGMRVLLVCIRRYPWLFGGDVVLTVVLYNVLLKSMVDPLVILRIARSPFALVYSTYLVVTVLIALVLFAVISEVVAQVDMALSGMAIRLVYIACYVLLSILVLSVVFNALAVFHVPSYFRYMVYPAMACVHVMIIHWMLQRHYSLREFVRSVEFTVNFVMYNIPFFVVVYGLFFGGMQVMHRGLVYLVTAWQQSGYIAYGIAALIVDKVGSLVVTTIFLTVLIHFYTVKYADRYTTLYFSS